MPIWRSSELISGRSGSPSRRLSARSKSQPREKSWSNSTGARLLSDGQACDAEQPYSVAYTQVHVPSLSTERSINGGYSVSSINGCENSQVPSSSGCVPASTPLAPPPAVSIVPTEHQTSIRRTLTGTPRRASSGVAGTGVQTYTMQYIGIANGELGILSQKQKLVPPKSRTSSAGGVSSVSSCGGVNRQGSHRPSTASSTPAADRATSIPAAVAAATAAANTTSTNTATTSNKSAPQPLSPSQPETLSRPTTAPPQRPPQHPKDNKSAAVHDANASESSPSADDMDRSSPRAASAPHNDGQATGSGSTGTTETGSSTLASPRLNLSSLVEDARGQVKVITECFYSRALHSHAGPHDRHVRRNRPVGPLVMDMEPLSTALPGRFGRRAPSAGGFPGWKLTTSAPSSTAGGSGGGDVGGRVTGPGAASPKAPSVESAVGVAPARSRIHSAGSVRSGKSARPSSGLASRLPAPERGDRSAGQGRGGAAGLGVFRGATAGPVLQYV